MGAEPPLIAPKGLNKKETPKETIMGGQGVHNPLAFSVYPSYFYDYITLYYAYARDSTHSFTIEHLRSLSS